jgi:predicted esterase
VTLELDANHSVVVSVPRGATGKKPLVVATHGAGGRAEAQCELWRRLVGDGAFVACPRGATALALPEAERRYFYRDHFALGAEVDAVLAAVRARFGPYLDDAEPLYSGYSQGAGMGAMILPVHAGRFARALLVEGGFGEYHEWDIPTARRWAEHGGKRALIVCGRPKCAELGRESAAYLERGGVTARVAFVDGAGHDWHGLETRIAAELGWLTEGDGRWPAAAAVHMPQR